MNARSMATSTRVRLAQLASAASRRPWAVLWFVVPISWQLAARAVGANRWEEALAILLTIPELIGAICLVGLLVWQMWALGTAVTRRLAHRPQHRWVYPWFARIGMWFCVGLLLASYIAP